MTPTTKKIPEQQYIDTLHKHFKLNFTILQQLWKKILSDLNRCNTDQLLLHLETLVQTVRLIFEDPRILKNHSIQHIDVNQYVRIFDALFNNLYVPNIRKQKQKENIIKQLRRLSHQISDSRPDLYEMLCPKDNDYFGALLHFLDAFTRWLKQTYTISDETYTEIDYSIVKNPDATELSKQDEMRQAIQKYLDKRYQESEQLKSTLEQFAKEFTQLANNNNSIWNRFWNIFLFRKAISKNLLQKVTAILSNDKTSILKKISQLMDLEEKPCVRQYTRLHDLLLKLIEKLPDDIRRNRQRNRIYCTQPHIVLQFRSTTTTMLNSMDHKPTKTIEEVFESTPQTTTRLGKVWRRLTSCLHTGHQQSHDYVPMDYVPMGNSRNTRRFSR